MGYNKYNTISDVSGGASPSIIEEMRSAIATSIHLSFGKDNYEPLTYKDVFYLATLGAAKGTYSNIIYVIYHRISNLLVHRFVNILFHYNTKSIITDFLLQIRIRKIFRNNCFVVIGPKLNNILTFHIAYLYSSPLLL